MDVRVPPIDPLLTIRKCLISSVLYIEHTEQRATILGLRMGRKGQMERSISIPVLLRKASVPRQKVNRFFWELFWLDRTDPFSFRLNFWKFLVELIPPILVNPSGAGLGPVSRKTR